LKWEKEYRNECTNTTNETTNKHKNIIKEKNTKK